MAIKNEITIIFPVYGNHEIFISILDVLFISGFKGCIIIINDKPDDESAGKDILKFIERRSNCSYIANKFNEGYTKSVNKALAKVKTEFVMICNSDAFITQCALEIMFKDLKKYDPIVGVQPLSDNAGGYSPNLPIYDWVSYSAMEAVTIINKISDNFLLEFGPNLFIQPDINGFCSLWKTSAIKKVEFLDEINFPLGYGEETDLSIKSLNLGNLVAISLSAFVPHIRSVSFKIEQKEFLKKNAKQKLGLKWGANLNDEIRQFHNKSILARAFKA
jgi:GT2 family glycosyltransferase